jgi:hypothetical protein
MDLNHGSTGYEPVGISGRTASPTAFLTTLPRYGAAQSASVYELRGGLGVRGDPLPYSRTLRRRLASGSRTPVRNAREGRGSGRGSGLLEPATTFDGFEVPSYSGGWQAAGR